MPRRFLLLASALFVLAVGATMAASSLLGVQVRDARLRAKPSALGATVATLAYGASVTQLQVKGDWYQVKDGAGRTGWLHVSAVTTKKIVMKSGTGTVSSHASGEDVALAGKGFNPEVESAYRKENPSADFRAVDAMETVRVTAEDMASFAAKGVVVPEDAGESTPAEGGAK
jgi:uncharacterized protein YgiM (DUF1202 family)